VWVGGGAPAGIFDSRPLARKISHRIPWRQLSRNLKSGLVRALTVCATNVATGRATLYIDRAPGVPLPALANRMVIRPTHILPHHVLASAAMPMIFPPVRIGNDYFCDGGIRLNTPTAPAIHLGVDRLFVVGVSTPVARPEHDRRYEIAGAPGASFLFGRAVNALMLDHLNHDLEEVQLVNHLLDDAISVFGESFIHRLNAAAVAQGRPQRRIIRVMSVRPSLDLGRLAAEHLRTHRTRLGKLFGRSVLRMLDVGENADADLASYLLFDGDYARVLIDLGRKDAAARRDELEEFLRPSQDVETSPTL
jgi:NTE family protein